MAYPGYLLSVRRQYRDRMFQKNKPFPAFQNLPFEKISSVLLNHGRV